MITAFSEKEPLKTLVSDGEHELFADTTQDKGGQNAGFRPHELLEAALAACLNMYVRTYADNHSMPIEKVVSKVELDRSDPTKTVFRHHVEIEGDLSEAQREMLAKVADACPVRKTLSKPISWELLP